MDERTELAPVVRLCSPDEWANRIRRVHDQLYTDLVETIECGAFDGGCVVMAEAIKSVFGGEIVCLTRAGDLADHAAVLIDGMLVDYDGPLPAKDFIVRFNDFERPIFPVTAHRRFTQDDLPNAVRNPELVKRCARLIATAFDISPVLQRKMDGTRNPEEQCDLPEGTKEKLGPESRELSPELEPGL